MSTDIYVACPCGSGKKLKFCCLPINDEMDRIMRLIEGNQPRVALQQLEALAKKHPANTWVGTTQAMLLLELYDFAAARTVLERLLEAHPENEMAIVLYAAAMLQSEGFEAAKRAIHRAFQRSAKKLPALVSDLAASVAAVHFSREQMMAAREHLALALRLAPEDRRQQLFVQLLELDGAVDVAYPLRGAHQLPNVDGPEEFQKEVRKAQKYAAVGCWSVAAELFAKLAEATPERAELWHSAGLCRAWDGDEAGAAVDLRRAGRHYQDLGIAVECETIAQILGEATGSDVIEQVNHVMFVHSVSRLLTLLDAHPRLMRVVTSSEHEVKPAAEYLLLKGNKSDINLDPQKLEDLAEFIAQVAIFDRPEEEGGPCIAILTYRGPQFDEAKAVLTAVVGDLIRTDGEPAHAKTIGTVAAELFPITTMWYYPREISVQRRRQLAQQHCVDVIEQQWPRIALRALDGKTPEQAASDPAMRVPLLGAIYAFDAWLLRRSRLSDLRGLCRRIGIEPLPVLEVTDNLAVGQLSVMQMNRLPFARLTDAQLVTVVNRLLLVRHDETVYEALKEAVNRPECAVHFDAERIYRALAEICASQGRREEAFMWMKRGRDLPVTNGGSTFEHAWKWDLAEFSARLEDPTDPNLNEIIQRFVHYYHPKLPQIRPYIEQLLRNVGLPSPWETTGIITPDQLSSNWTAPERESVPAGGSKLWLPGQ